MTSKNVIFKWSLPKSVSFITKHYHGNRAGTFTYL